MSLTEDLANRREQARNRIPADKLVVMDRATEDLVQAGIASMSLKEGDSAPAFELPDAEGTLVSLGALLRKGPVVLSFYRGGW
jgi:hypothetical protein